MDNIRRVDLNLLTVLDVLLSEQSVSRAGKRLNLSQPAVSGSLKRLRATFNDPLFIRTQQGIRPTPFALELIGPVKAVLHDIEAIFSTTEFVPHSADNTIVIAGTDYAQTTFLAPLMSHVQKGAPNIRFSIVSTDNDQMPEQLNRQEIDFAVTVAEMAPADVPSFDLFEDRYVGALSASHPLAGKDLSLDEFCSLDHVLVTPSSDGFYGPTDEALAAVGKTRRVAVTLPNFLSLPHILWESRFVTVAPERILSPFSDQLFIFAPPISLPKISMICVWHELSSRLPAHTWLRDRMAEIASDMTLGF